MNKEQFLGEWHRIRGQIRQQWGKLTEDDIEQIKGKREELIGKLVSRYGYAKEQAERELANWEKTILSASSEQREVAGKQQTRY